MTRRWWESTHLANFTFAFTQLLHRVLVMFLLQVKLLFPASNASLQVVNSTLPHALSSRLCLLQPRLELLNMNIPDLKSRGSTENGFRVWTTTNLHLQFMPLAQTIDVLAVLLLLSQLLR